MRIPILLAAMLCAGSATAEPAAAPSAEVARRCVKLSYLAFPYKRPGSTRGSGERQAYYKDCVDKEGKVPEPVPAPESKT